MKTPLLIVAAALAFVPTLRAQQPALAHGEISAQQDHARIAQPS